MRIGRRNYGSPPIMDSHQTRVMKNGRHRNAGARIIERWEQSVKTTASQVIGGKYTVYNRAAKWWDEVKEAVTVRSEAHSRYTRKQTTAGWEECAIARKSKRWLRRRECGKTYAVN